MNKFKIKNLKGKFIAGVTRTPKLVSGFTLIETLVAVSIFTAAIMGMLGVLSDNLKDINYAKRKAVATYLAQEGIEYFHNMRDTFVLYQSQGNNGWNDFLIKIVPCERTQGSGGCYFRDEMDYIDNNAPITGPLFGIVQCVNSDCPVLTYNASVGSYGYTGTTSSGFTRKVNTVQVNDHEVQIISTVSWEYAGKKSEVTFSENLFSWQKGI